MDLLDRYERGSAAVFEERARSPGSYKGPERRLDHRRQRGDRREELRFELDKPDRRARPGRRATDKRPTFI
jgi:hypothetical protein